MYVSQANWVGKRLFWELIALLEGLQFEVHVLACVEVTLWGIEHVIWKDILVLVQENDLGCH